MQFVSEHFEQRYTGLKLANNWDFTVLKRSLRCEKNRNFCKIDSLGSNLYRVASYSLYMAKLFKRFSYIRNVYSFLCFFVVCRSSNAQVRPYDTVCVVFTKYIFKTQRALLPPLPFLAKGVPEQHSKFWEKFHLSICFGPPNTLKKYHDYTVMLKGLEWYAKMFWALVTENMSRNGYTMQATRVTWRNCKTGIILCVYSH